MKLISAICLLFATCALGGDLYFSDMENGDRVEMTEHSFGCFHNWTHYYEVWRFDDSFLFSEYAITWDKNNPSQIVEKKNLGKMTLTAKDIKNLDALLKYYRGKKEGNSTTYTSLVVEFYEPDRRVKVENLEDGSGGMSLGKDILSLYQLSQRLPNQP